MEGELNSQDFEMKSSELFVSHTSEQRGETITLQNNLDGDEIQDQAQPLNINPNRITRPDANKIPNTVKMAKDKERTDSTKNIE